MSIRIALLSDDRLFCDGILRLLDVEPSFTVVALDGEQHRGLHWANGFNVVLIDSALDNAFALCTEVDADAAAILIAAPADADWCHDALCAGASGVLPRQAGATDLVRAVRAVHEGSIWAPRRVMATCIRHLVASTGSRHNSNAMLEQNLSRREREIFRQAAAGLANKELASRFDIGEATVKAHLTHIFQKLGVRGRAELAAVYHHVVAPPDPSAGFLLMAAHSTNDGRRKSNGPSGNVPRSKPFR
jgi:DNA-binding NarL/FixJ family response regulator